MKGLFSTRYAVFILSLTLTGFVLHWAKPFLVPVCISGILAMLFLPFCRRLEASGLSRGLAAFLSVLSIIIILGLLGIALSVQISNLAGDMAHFQMQVAEALLKIRSFIVSVVGLSMESQDAYLNDRQQVSARNDVSIFLNIFNSAGILLINTILVIVYTFLLLQMREHIKSFIVKLVSNSSKENTEAIIRDVSSVGQHYIRGISLMILSLWIMYGLGFSLIGVKYALFFAILCGLLELVPFIGNITGTLITILMSVSWGGDNRLILAILVTYGTVQFIQSYFLEPLVVGSGVNLNPLFSIMALAAGEMIWGIPGMILALPLLGMLKIIFDHLEPMKPYGFLIGRIKSKASFTQRLAKIFHRSPKY